MTAQKNVIDYKNKNKINICKIMDTIFLVNYDGTLDSFNDNIDRSIKHLKEENVDDSIKNKTETQLANDRMVEKLEDLKELFNNRFSKLSIFSHVYFSNIDVTNTSIRRYSGYTLRPILEEIEPIVKKPYVIPLSIKVLLFILLFIAIIIIIIGCYCYFLEIDIITPSSVMAGL